MKVVSEALKTELEQKLQLIQSQTTDPLLSAEESIKVLIWALEKLKTACVNYKFQSNEEEITFFREIKPQWASELIYYNQIYNLETNKPFGTVKTLQTYWEKELKKLEKFYQENTEFYRYYRMGNRSLDKKYFIRGKHDLRYTLDSYYFQADQRFSTSHDFKVAQILANDKLKTYLELELHKLQNKINPYINNTPSGKALKWTASKVALIELLYALQSEGVFNNGTIELKELASLCEKTFHIDLGQFHRTFLEIRARKSERTKFLNTLRHNLIIRMDQADENQ